MHRCSHAVCCESLGNGRRRSILITPGTLFFAALVILLVVSERLEAHPLDPLSTNEVSLAAQVLRASGNVSSNDLFTLIELREPPKEQVLAWSPGAKQSREAHAVVLKRQANTTFAAVVDLASKSILSWARVPGVQPLWTATEDAEAVALVRTNAEWQAAMKRRGFTNFSEISISTWMPGHAAQSIKDRRHFRTAFYFKGTGTNFYGPPIEGVEAVVDLNQMKVVHVIDLESRAIAAESADFFDPRVRGQSRPRLTPLITTQPEGPSYSLLGNEVRWDRWRFRYGFNPREGLVLYLIRYEDSGRERSILYRASISELLVPYGDPSQTWFWRNATDEGEYGLGGFSAPLRRGRNTAAYATLLDVTIPNDVGAPEVWPDRIDLYEREGDTMWTHYDAESQANEARRSRELVVGFVATIGNYDYSYHWIFRQDGSIEFTAELTGIILTKGVDLQTCEVCRQNRGQPGTSEPAGQECFGTLVAPHTLGVNHQHFINVRLDFDVDGTSNSVKEINATPLPPGRRNPAGNAFVARQTIFAREREAVRDANPASHRMWAVFNPNAVTALGHFPAYALEPGANAVPFLSKESAVRKFSGFIDHQFFATRFHPGELNAAGPFPAHAPRPDNVLTWTRDNELISNQDIVVWYTFGLTHLPRPEDYPVMPAARAGFRLVPKGFFDRNPALDVPEPTEPRL